MYRAVFTFIFLCFQFCLFATTISPYKNLTHLQQSSHSIYLGTAIAQETIANGNISETFTIFQVRNTIKGSDLQTFKIKSASKKIGDVLFNVEGDMDFHLQETYLLFLKDKPDGSKSPICLSYYIFQEIIMNGIQLLVPSFNQDEFKLAEVDHQKIHYVYKKEELLESLKSASVQKPLQIEESVAPLNYQSLVYSKLKNAPDHCRYFGSSNYRFRIENAESESVPVYYQGDVGSGCSNIQSQISNALNHLNANYQGINMSLMGTFSGYQPVCGTNIGAGVISSFGGNYDTFINQQYPGANGRVVLIQFDDPCSEIDPLDGCSGVLAIGGTSALGTHVLDGETFYSAKYGYVVVNEDTGTCHCNSFTHNANLSTYSLMMAHEITHTMGLKHIEPQYGVANMNPSNNSAITGLDVQCVTDLYPAATASPCTVLTVELNEDFETFDLCSVSGCTVSCSLGDGWINSADDDIDWRVDEAGTWSSSTGPYTFTGKYLYTEASGCYNKDALLISPCYNLTNITNPTCTFTANMNGSNMGTLQVGFSVAGAPVQYQTQISGNQGANWFPVTIDVPQAEDVRIYIKGTTGPSFRSDMAIDNFKISSSSGTNPGCENGNNYREDFESNGICSTSSNPCNRVCEIDNGWINESDDDMDWRINSGRTPSSSTGPSSDKNPGTTTGKYVYTEASGYCRNQQAILTSPCFNLTSMDNPILQFSYHMYGSAMGKLELGISTDGSTWTYQLIGNGELADYWASKLVSLPASNSVQIRFVGTTGASFRSDMAIDDILIFDGQGPDALPEVASTLKSKTNQKENRSIEGLQVLISPNPASDQFKIHLENVESNQAIIEIYNTSGQRILQRNISAKGIVNSEVTAEINTTQFHPGMYFVSVISKDQRVNKKLMVKINSL